MTAAALFIISLAVNSTAFTFRESHPSALFPYIRAVPESAVAGRYVNPAYLPGGPALFLDMAYSRPYGLEGLHAGSVHGGGATRRLGGMLAWRGFGIDEYREESAEASAAMAPAFWLRAGATVSAERLIIQTDQASLRETQWDIGASAVLSPFPWIEAGFRQEHIRSLADRAGRDLHFPEWSAGAALRPARGFAASWNITREYFGLVNTLAVSANLLDCLSVSGGYSRETSSLAGSVILIVGGMMISYGLRYHGYLGATHSFGAAFVLGMPAPDEISYHRRIIRRAPPGTDPRAVDLATCTADELLEVPGMERPVAERLVKYRAVMGPLGRRALIQMGVTAAEFRAMEPHIKNLAPDEDRREKFRDRKKKKQAGGHGNTGLPFRSNENRRALFQALVREGVKAASALRVAEIARGIDRNALDKKIGGLPFLSDEEKKAARRACAAH